MAASDPVPVYFAGSIRGGREDAALYADIVRYMQSAGLQVLTEHVAAATLGEMGETHLSEAEIYERDAAWLARSKLVVAECTTPSLGVGYELAYAEARGIPVLVLFRDGAGRSLSAMVAGNKYFTVARYSDLAGVCAAIDEFVKGHAME
jgi:2'-deoxynucleoside 5'-phosphate N-hydrolase